MIAYIVRRLVHAVLVLWAAFTLSFLLMNLVPGNPLLAIIGADNLNTTPRPEIRALDHQFGFDRPIPDRYWDQLWHALQGNLGTSYATRGSVAHMLINAAPPTLELAGSALLLAVVGGFLLAFAATYTRVRWLRSLLLMLPPLAASIPTFWSGLVLLEIISFRLGWLPAAGDTGIRGLILPAVTLSLPLGAVLAQVLARSLENTLDEPYVQVVRAKGASRARIYLSHALRNASIPALTVLGILVATALGGSVVVEAVFSRNGIGQVAKAAVTSKDIPVAQGVVILAATAYVAVSLLIDLVYPIIDPRIRLWGERS